MVVGVVVVGVVVVVVVVLVVVVEVVASTGQALRGPQQQSRRAVLGRLVEHDGLALDVAKQLSLAMGPEV